MNKFKSCLVLGGRGFIGLHLVDALLAHGYFVRCFDLPNTTSLPDFYRFHPNFELYEGNFGNNLHIAEALVGCDVCFHLVSTTLPLSSNLDPIFDISTNLLNTVNFLNFAIKSGLKKIIFVSSGGTVYGIPKNTPIAESHSTEPICSYGVVKLAIEKYLFMYYQLYNLDYTILRVANPFGERQRTTGIQGAIAIFLGKVLKGELIEIWGDGNTIRDYIYISDVVDALIGSIEWSFEEKIFNIGSGNGKSINEILDAIENITGRVSNRRYLSNRSIDVPKNVLSIERITQLTNWFPKILFDDGLAKFYNWLQK